jgi:hypothetical protein
MNAAISFPTDNNDKASISAAAKAYIATPNAANAATLSKTLQNVENDFRGGVHNPNDSYELQKAVEMIFQAVPQK